MTSALPRRGGSIEVKSKTARPGFWACLASSLVVILSFSGCAGIPTTTTITTSQLPNAQPGVSYAAALNATGGLPPYHWALASGILPVGIKLNATSGVLTGMTTQSGNYRFTVQASDSSPNKAGTDMRAMTLSVGISSLQVTTNVLPDVQTGSPIQTSITAHGGMQPYHWSIASGTLPSGASLNADSGMLSGKASQEGQFDFNVQVSDSSSPKPQTAMKALRLAVVALALQVTTGILPTGEVGVPFQVPIAASGGIAPYTWKATGTLPSGLSLMASSGEIVGTPAAAGQFSFTMQVRDSGSPPLTASRESSITVEDASPLDQYGGDAKHRCVGTIKNGSPIPGTTASFYLYKDTNLKHWMFCDPLGNRYFYQAVQVIDPGYYANPSTIINGKYTGNYYPSQVTRLEALGFNAIGEIAHTAMLPIGYNANSNKMPFVWLISPSHYSLQSGSKAPKDMVPLLPPAYNHFNGWRGGQTPDYFDPQWTTYINGIFSPSSTFFNWASSTPAATLDASPWYIATTTDDADYLWTLRGTHGGWAAGVYAPYAAYMRVNQGGNDVLYSDPVVYTKQQLKTYLLTKYGTVGALNTAWGSNYTTFGSTATTLSSETIGTGDGSTTSFSHTFLHTPVDPGSILISVGGKPSAGDCPWFEYYCNTGIGNSDGVGNIIGVSSTVNGATVNYKTGVITLTFSSAPAKGVAVTVSYQYGGWPKDLAGGTGLLDEDGTSSWYPTRMSYPPTGAVQTDLDAFYGLLVEQYFSTLTSLLRTNLPHHLVIGPDALCVTLEPTFLSQAAQYLDGFLANCTESAYNGNTGQSVATAAYNLMGIPIIPHHAIVTISDSRWTWENCNATGWSYRCAPTQQGRGRLYQSWGQQWFNNYIGADGYGFIVGWDWWQYTDNISEKQNFGLVSSSDNLYDGIQDKAIRVTDPLGFVTIPEAGNYGDFSSYVRAANRIWRRQ